MKATFESCEFIGSFYRVEQLPTDGKVEAALFGRSNVGKSSMINALVGRSMARVSKTPGKTRAMNYYLIDGRYYLVDVPGYGFAQTGARLKNAWRRMIDEWAHEHPAPKMVVQLIDASVPPQSSDRELAEWLGSFGWRRITVACKADRVKSSERVRQARTLSECFGNDLIFFSARSGEGQRDVLNSLYQTMKDSI